MQATVVVHSFRLRALRLGRSPYARQTRHKYGAFTVSSASAVTSNEK